MNHPNVYHIPTYAYFLSFCSRQTEIFFPPFHLLKKVEIGVGSKQYHDPCTRIFEAENSQTSFFSLFFCRGLRQHVSTAVKLQCLPNIVRAAQNPFPKVALLFSTFAKSPFLYVRPLQCTLSREFRMQIFFFPLFFSPFFG